MTTRRRTGPGTNDGSFAPASTSSGTSAATGRGYGTPTPEEIHQAEYAESDAALRAAGAIKPHPRYGEWVDRSVSPELAELHIERINRGLANLWDTGGDDGPPETYSGKAVFSVDSRGEDGADYAIQIWSNPNGPQGYLEAASRVLRRPVESIQGLPDEEYRTLVEQTAAEPANTQFVSAENGRREVQVHAPWKANIFQPETPQTEGSKTRTVPDPV